MSKPFTVKQKAERDINQFFDNLEAVVKQQIEDEGFHETLKKLGQPIFGPAPADYATARNRTFAAWSQNDKGQIY